MLLFAFGVWNNEILLLEIKLLIINPAFFKKMLLKLIIYIFFHHGNLIVSLWTR